MQRVHGRVGQGDDAHAGLDGQGGGGGHAWGSVGRREQRKEKWRQQ
jgi:hypothetical protein